MPLHPAGDCTHLHVAGGPSPRLLCFRRALASQRRGALALPLHQPSLVEHTMGWREAASLPHRQPSHPQRHAGTTSRCVTLATAVFKAQCVEHRAAVQANMAQLAEATPLARRLALTSAKEKREQQAKTVAERHSSMHAALARRIAQDVESRSVCAFHDMVAWQLLCCGLCVSTLTHYPRCTASRRGKQTTCLAAHHCLWCSRSSPAPCYRD